MAETFSQVGKMEAIDQFYRLSAYAPVTGLSYVSAKGGRITTATRMYLEGIDFNLVYFPLKHLGYKCVGGVGQTGNPAGPGSLDGHYGSGQGAWL